MYLAGPFKGAPLWLVAVTPALAGPYDYGTVVVRVAIHVDPLDAQVIADLRHGAVDHRRHPDPDALDPGQHRQAELHDQPDQLLALQRSTPRESATRAPSPTSPPTSTPVNCATLAVQAEDDGPPARRPQGRPARGQNPALQFDLHTRPGDANIKSLAVTLPSAFEIDQRHLGNICSEKELAETQCAGRAADRQGDDDDAAARPAARGPGLRGLGLGRPAAAGLHPQRPGQAGAARRTKTVERRPPADHGAGRPRRADRPLPADRLRRQAGLPGNTRDLCKHVPVARVAITAQNGKTSNRTVKVKVSCGNSASAKRTHH